MNGLPEKKKGEPSNPQPQEQTLQTNLSKNSLIDYFANKRPHGLTGNEIADFSCLGLAWLLVDELGGREKARIYWFEDYSGGHAWVAELEADPESKPYNNYLGLATVDDETVTVHFVQEKGEDITDDVFDKGWEKI